MSDEEKNSTAAAEAAPSEIEEAVAEASTDPVAVAGPASTEGTPPREGDSSLEDPRSTPDPTEPDASADPPSESTAAATDGVPAADSGSGSEADTAPSAEVGPESPEHSAADSGSAGDPESSEGPKNSEGPENSEPAEEGTSQAAAEADDGPADAGGAAPVAPGPGKSADGKRAPAKKKTKTKAKAKAKAKSQRKKSAAEERFSRAMAENEVLTGKVIGWNNGGFHVVIEKTTAFCPRSEMESGSTAEPESYLDQELDFCVLRVQDKGRRVVVSRSKLQRREAAAKRGELRQQLREGLILEGTVDSLAEFGAFVDLGGLRGLVHVSEISHQRVEKPSDHLEVGQQVQVKVLRIEQGGKRISLSMKQLADNPWDGIKKRFPEGDVVAGVVDHSNPAGAVIELEPGITGFLPRKAMSLPMEAAVPRAFPPGKEVKVQIMSVDPRRQRLSLALEGNTLEGSRTDLVEFKKKASKETGSFNALADALQKARGESTAD